MLVKTVLVESKSKNGQNDELGAQLSQVFCLFPFVKILAKKGTILVEKGTVFARKGTTEVNSKRPKALSSSKQRGIKSSAKHKLE